MKLLKAIELATEYKFAVHLDETKLKNGEPDPDYVIEYTWGKQPPKGRALSDYLSDCKREVLLLAEMELAKKQPPQEMVIP